MKNIICTLVKDETSIIEEWVKHNLNIGFEKIYVFEDYDSISHTDILKHFIDTDKVEINRLEETHYVERQDSTIMLQQKVFYKFFEQCKTENIAEWCGFFDTDEFVMFEEGWNLNSLEDEFADTAGILLAWKNFGANGHLTKVDNLVKNYTVPSNMLIDNNPRWNMKSLVNIKNAIMFEDIHIICNGEKTDHSHKIIKAPLIYDKTWINHYFTRSWEEFKHRMLKRGNMGNNYRTFDLFFELSPEFADKEKEMIDEVRYEHCNGTMWISKKHNIISGGNVNEIKKLNLLLKNKSN